MEYLNLSRIQVLSIVGSCLVLVMLFELIRRKRLRIQYSLILVAMGLVFLLLSCYNEVLKITAVAVGIVYPPSVLVVVAIGALFCAVLHFSVVVSKQADTNRVLAQELSILQHALKQLEKQIDQPQ